MKNLKKCVDKNVDGLERYNHTIIYDLQPLDFFLR